MEYHVNTMQNRFVCEVSLFCNFNNRGQFTGKFLVSPVFRSWNPKEMCLSNAYNPGHNILELYSVLGQVWLASIKAKLDI